MRRRLRSAIGQTTTEFVMIGGLTLVVATGFVAVMNPTVRETLQQATECVISDVCKSDSTDALLPSAMPAPGAPGLPAPLEPPAVPVADNNQSKGIKTGLGEAVDAIVNQSPKFQDKIRQLEGWTIEYGNHGGTTDKDTKIISIDEKYKNDPNLVATVLAHEVGHATFNNTEIGADGLTREEFISRNLSIVLADEGEATLTQIELQRDFDAHQSTVEKWKLYFGKKSKLANYSLHSWRYNQVYRDYLKDGDRARARARIGELYAKYEKTSNTGENYQKYYERSLGEVYDKWLASQPKGKTT